MNVDSVPFFTERDESLLKSALGRDPLGLAPVWASFARELIPTLSGPVTSAYGVKAVVLIYGLYPQVAAVVPKLTLRSFFVIMEQILEYFLYQYQKRHVYGANTLTRIADTLHVKSDVSGLLANGLYWYYRGTLRRAGIVGNNLIALTRTYEAWCARSSEIRTLIAPLVEMVKKVMEVKTPAKDFLAQSTVSVSLAGFFGDTSLSSILAKSLLPEPTTWEFAEMWHRANHLDDRGTRAHVNACIQEIDSLKSTPTRLTIRGELDNMRKAEEFLFAFEKIFGWLQTQHTHSRKQIASSLAPFSEGISSAANKYLSCRLSENGPSERLGNIAGIARKAANGAWPEFLTAIEEYHGLIAESRQRERLLQFEAESLTVTWPSNGNGSSGPELTDLENQWMHGYYLWPCFCMYDQLVQDGRHCLRSDDRQEVDDE